MRYRHFGLLALALLGALTLAGCGSIQHSRVSLGPDGKVTAQETESAHGFFMKGAVDKLNISTKDGTYSHTLSGAGAQVQGDTEMLKTAIESTGKAVGEGIGAAARTTAGAPVAP